MRWLERLEESLVALLMAAMTLITCLQVVARYVFNYSFVWALELTGVLFAWLIFVGMSYGVRVGAHIGIDAAVRLLRPGTARRVGLLAAGLCVAYAVIVAVGGWQYVRKMHEVGILMQDLPIEQWIPRVVVPLGFALLALRFGQAFVRLARGERTQLLHDEAEAALRLRQQPTALGEVRE
ncbi:MAG TPA: TRAP transporter small permease [Caldimonas sp.]|jgi:C4-dicarboxylate transporter DctQ subunit|nr:TRAP transporter small permease [Caldimonas sp.]HEX2539466.1 TRAP transporter small permease [Caldimonas sp.]